MGQRLNLELIAGKKSQLMANCYYHWSAYTLSTILIVKDVIDHFNELNDKYGHDPFLLSVKCFEIPGNSYRFNEETGKYEMETVYAGLCERSHKLMKFLYPDTEIHEAIDRNVGLISIHPADVDSTRFHEEGRAIVDLDNKRFSFDIWICWEKEDYIADMLYDVAECNIERELSEIPILPDEFIPYVNDFGMSEFLPFDMVEDLIELINQYQVYQYQLNGHIYYIQWFC